MRRPTSDGRPGPRRRPPSQPTAPNRNIWRQYKALQRQEENAPRMKTYDEEGERERRLFDPFNEKRPLPKVARASESRSSAPEKTGDEVRKRKKITCRETEDGEAENGKRKKITCRETEDGEAENGKRTRFDGVVAHTKKALAERREKMEKEAQEQVEREEKKRARQEQRNQHRKSLLRVTRRGQPIMKNVINHYIGKLGLDVKSLKT